MAPSPTRPAQVRRRLLVALLTVLGVFGPGLTGVSGAHAADDHPRGTAGGTGPGGRDGGGTGSFPITFQNNTGGTYGDAQVYVTVLGQVTPGQWSYMKPDGSMVRIDHLDATAPGHLTKNGVDYPDMSFTLAQTQARTVPSPSQIRGGRIYVSRPAPAPWPRAATRRSSSAPNSAPRSTGASSGDSDEPTSLSLGIGW